MPSLAEPTSPGELRTTFQGLLNLALTRGHASPTWSGLGPEPSLPSISWHMNIPTLRRTALRRRTTPLNTSTVTAGCSSPQAADAKPSVAQRRTPQGLGCHPSQAARDSLLDATFVAIGHSQAVVGDHLVVCNDTDKSISPVPVPAPCQQGDRDHAPSHREGSAHRLSGAHRRRGGLTWLPNRLVAAEINPMAYHDR